LKHKFVSLLIVCLLAIQNMYGQQEFYFRHYQVENGLSHNTVMCSLQDEKGFIWLGTKDGLNRFDGNAFKVFTHNEENNNSIGTIIFAACILIKQGGCLWAHNRGFTNITP